MADLRDGVNTTRARYQEMFNGVFALNKQDRDDALTSLLKNEIFSIEHKPKWALFSLYVLYELLYHFARTNSVDDTAYAYQLVTLLLYSAMQDIQGPAKIDLPTLRSFLQGTLKTGRAPTDNDELTDFKSKNLCKNPITIGPKTVVTFETFISDVVGPGLLRDLSGGKSRRRRQHRRFRSKKRGRKSLRKRRN